MDDLGEKIGQKINELRTKKGDSLRTVGEAIGVDYSYISRIEKGRKPSLDLLEKIADYFEVPVDYLLGKTSTSELNPFEENFINDIDKLTLEEIISKYAPNIDGKPATKEEIEGAITFIRMLRNQKS